MANPVRMCERVLRAPAQRASRASEGRFALAVLFAGLVVASACGTDRIVRLPDGGFGSPDVCDVLAQARCQVGEKCTWIRDAAMPTPLGHIGCAPDGTVAVGGPCAYGAPGPMGFDNCAAGSVCVSGRCGQICDQTGGPPTCAADFACQSYANLFQVSSRTAAGVCDPQCDPFLDNDFDGVGTISTRRSDSPCVEKQGCFGFPGAARPTVFTCSVANDPMLVHRTQCTVANGCAPNTMGVFINGCAPGYIPLLKESTGSSEAICVAYCKPQDCYAGAGNCPNGQQGVEPHVCKAGGMAQGTFEATEACTYIWRFQYDMTGQYIPSQWSDEVGICMDHAKYTYGSGINPPTWPACNMLEIGENFMDGFDAAFFGCVSTAKATELGNPPFAPTPTARAMTIEMPRVPYRAVVRASE